MKKKGPKIHFYQPVMPQSQVCNLLSSAKIVYASFCKHHRFLSMAAESPSGNDVRSLMNYPVPLSPPLPSLSKNIELSRALTASSKSALFSLSRTHVLYEDQWLIAINKPQGVYCENVLSAVPCLLNDPASDSG